MEAILPYLGVGGCLHGQGTGEHGTHRAGCGVLERQHGAQVCDRTRFYLEVVGDGTSCTDSPRRRASRWNRAGAADPYTERRAERTTVTVPDLLGRTAVSANETLAARQLNIRIRGTNNYLSGTGAVAIAQDPPAGTEVKSARS